LKKLKGVFMKISKSIFTGMIVFVLLFGLAGCITISGTQITYEETETSQEIFKAISESIPSKTETYGANSKLVLEQRITAGELISLVSNKFPGLTEKGISGGGISCVYQGVEYRISCEFETSGTVSVVGRNTIVLGVFSVKATVVAE
jgi:hypothetical protein